LNVVVCGVSRGLTVSSSADVGVCEIVLVVDFDASLIKKGPRISVSKN
jgi:hypothetical protein